MSYRVALVSCVKSKRTSAVAAKDLYVSPLFKGMRKFAEENSDLWLILSAEHGVVRPNQVIEPYERTLTGAPKILRIGWARGVNHDLIDIIPAGSEVIILAGLQYREHIVPFLKLHGFNVSIPMKGLKLGSQLQWLNQQARPVREDSDLVTAAG